MMMQVRDYNTLQLELPYLLSKERHLGQDEGFAAARQIGRWESVNNEPLKPAAFAWDSPQHWRDSKKPMTYISGGNLAYQKLGKTECNTKKEK